MTVLVCCLYWLMVWYTWEKSWHCRTTYLQRMAASAAVAVYLLFCEDAQKSGIGLFSEWMLTAEFIVFGSAINNRAAILFPLTERKPA